MIVQVLAEGNCCKSLKDLNCFFKMSASEGKVMRGKGKNVFIWEVEDPKNTPGFN